MENGDDEFRYVIENKKFDDAKNRTTTKNNIEKDGARTIRNVNTNLENIQCATKLKETYRKYHVIAYNKEIEQEEKRNIDLVDTFNLLELLYVIENSTFLYESIIDPIQTKKDSKKTMEDHDKESIREYVF